MNHTPQCYIGHGQSRRLKKTCPCLATAEAQLAEALRRQNPHDTDEVIKLMNAAASALERLALPPEGREQEDTVPRSRYNVACDQYNELKQNFERRLIAVVEECAKECERQKKRWHRGEQTQTISDHDACAAAIRASLPQPQSRSE